MLQGIDVSRWQGRIDWDKVKASGIQFAILKCGGSDAGFYTDRTFDRNYAECKRVGIAVGAYYFVGKDCISYEAGQADAKRMISICAGKDFELPLFIDCEAQSPEHKVGITDAVLGFYDTMKAEGRRAGVYASAVSGFRDRIEDERIHHIPHWVAQYYTMCTYGKPWIIWQKSSKGTVDGINGNVDMNEGVDDLLNIQPEVKKTDLDIILAVLKGEYSTGADRGRMLTQAGYNPSDVQDKINKIYTFIDSIL